MFGPYDRFRSAKKLNWRVLESFGGSHPELGEVSLQKTLCDYRDFICNLPLTQKMHKCKRRKLRSCKRNLETSEENLGETFHLSRSPGFHYLRNVFSKP